MKLSQHERTHKLTLFKKKIKSMSLGKKRNKAMYV